MMKKHRFNTLDVLVILVLIAAVAIGGYIFLKNNNSVMFEGTVKAIEFDVEVTDLTLDVAESYTVGSPVVYGKTNSDSGVITNVVVEPHLRMMKNTLDGTFALEQYGNKHMATVTIKADIYDTETAYIASKEQVMIGMDMPFRGKGFASPQSYIVNMRVEGE